MRTRYFTADGQAVDLGQELGRGGEGAVHALASHSQQVAKIYHQTPSVQKQQKLAYMSASADAQLLSYISWPQQTLHRAPGGPVAGFLMPKVEGKRPIHMLYGPAHRKQLYPDAAWNFLLFAARNIASAFAVLHAHGHVIGDVNQGGVLVGKDSKVTLIDSDSFQINANGQLHLCEVGVAHFTPPELQALPSFTSQARTANHDNFGLALLIFHLLFGGRHPYSGVPLAPGVGDALETDIQHFRFAYGADHQQRGLRPPPRAIPLAMLPPDVQAMFSNAFTETGAHGMRPTAREWVAALDALRKNLRKCHASAMHIFPASAPACPWCALEKQGIAYFLQALASQAGTAADGSFVLARAIAAIRAIQPPPAPQIPEGEDIHPAPAPLPPGVFTKRQLMAIGIAAAIAVVALFWFFGALAGFAAGIGFHALIRYYLYPAWAKEKNARQRKLHDSIWRYEQLAEQVQEQAGDKRFRQKLKQLIQAHDQYLDLPRQEQQAIQEWKDGAHERQKMNFLAQIFIDEAQIPGIGPARKAALQSFGIETAADVSLEKVRQIKGFGEATARTMMDWRQYCEKRFVYKPALALTAADRAAIHQKTLAQQKSLESVLQRGPDELKKIRRQSLREWEKLKPRIEAVVADIKQQSADLNGMGS